MKNNGIEIADVFRAFMGQYRAKFDKVMLPSHQKAVRDIVSCMTPAMGGCHYQCQDCDETFWCYHGCRNRSCPKCHGRQIVIWMKKQGARMLPCSHFHVVATVPGEIRSLFLREQKYLYGLLMKTAANTLCELAKDKRYIGAVPGILAVLHTWTGQMHHHPHVHMLVTAGGVSDDGGEWRESRYQFLVPVKKLSPMIRKRFARELKKGRPDLFDQIPPKVWKKEWCSFCKHYGQGQDAVTRYLARYVFRIAITSNRILGMDSTHVTFKTKDNNTGEWKTQRIKGVDFIRRFLLHVLPKGFHKVRYYGLWSPGKRNLRLQARLILQMDATNKCANREVKLGDLAEEALSESNIESHDFVPKCPKCKSKNVILLEKRRRGEMRYVT